MKILKTTICAAAIAIMTSCGSKDEVASKTANSKISKATTELMTKMDANKDGKLSKDEVKGPLSNDFDKIDTNEDGYISLEELNNAPKPERGGNRQGPPRGGRQ